MASNEVNNCPNYTDHERRIGILEDGFNELNNKVIEMDKSYAVTNASILQTLKGIENLPETLVSVEKAMIGIQNNTNTNTEQIKNLFDKQDLLEKSIDTVDNEGKFNIRTYLQNHFVEIILGIGLVFMYFKK